MAALVSLLFRFIRLLGSGHEAITVENAALRLQLAAYQRNGARPKLTAFDRLFWGTLSKVWRRWRTALFVVRPDTVVRWQRGRFRKFWRISAGGGQRVAADLPSQPRYATSFAIWRLRTHFGARHGSMGS